MSDVRQRCIDPRAQCAALAAALLFDLLAEVRNDNAKGEYYLTDVVELARGRGAQTRTVLAGEDVADAHFRDLIDREPQLPAHLQTGARGAKT